MVQTGKPRTFQLTFARDPGHLATPLENA